MPAVATTTLIGVESATFAWDPAPGPVAEYLVRVSFNNEAMQLYAYVSNAQATVHGSFGDSIVVTVAGVSIHRRVRSIGPLSEPSEAVRFVEDPDAEPTPIPGNTPTSEPTPVSEPPPIPDPTPSPDANLDGADLILQNTDTGVVRVWSMAGLEILDRQYLVTSPGGDATSGDFNGDGIPDVLWRDETTGAIAVYVTGSGIDVLDPGADWVLGSVGDYNGDGRSDLSMRNELDDAVSTWLLNGAAVIDVIDHQFGFSSAAQLRSGDFDGDGTDDWLVQTSAGELRLVLLVDGSPPWTCGSSVGVRCFVRQSIDLDKIGAGWQLGRVGDFDADGRDDVLLRSSLGDSSTWTFDGADLVSMGSLPSRGLEWQVASIADLDGDGADDLIWRHTDGSLEGWLMDGSSITSAGRFATLGDPWIFAGPR